MSNNSVLIAGASQGLGREIANILIDRHYPTIALTRNRDRSLELTQLGMKVAIADALDDRELNVAIEPYLPIGTIISTIGGVSPSGQRVDYLGNKNLIDAAKKYDIRRFILISSLGAGETKDAIAPHVYQALAPALVEKELAENYLIESGLTYTILRPGGLKSLPATGNGILTNATNVAGSIHRSDVAILVERILNSRNADGQILSTFDRQMTYGDVDYPEFELS
jgi:nucleoside-diphosphate-sugar epimerase